MSLAELYQDTLIGWSDIQGHLETFVRIAHDLQATRVIELGTRGGVSTIAWLYALEGRGHVWSVDILPAPPFDADHWTFVLGDDCSPVVLAELPELVDIVFIDTSHAYDHTLRELRLYRKRVRPGGRILLHDTELEYPEDVGPSIAFPVKRAIEAYCAEADLTWTNHPHSYGLGVIEVP